MDWAHFILQHDADDLSRLALSRGRFGADVPDFDLALTTLEVRRKLRGKVPEWYAVPGLIYPSRLSGEQCSSTETACYKASVACSVVSGYSAPAFEGIFAGNEYQMGPGTVKNGPFCGCPVPEAAIADLTGGLGVDSWAFSKVFGKVLYNEMQPALADAARHNFALLGADNIVVRNCTLGSADALSDQTFTGAPSDQTSVKVPANQPSAGVPSTQFSVQQILDGFQPDIIFLDPARRAADGRKVFRLEDCQPDVLKLLPELLDASPLILLKLSPMADISLVCKQLGCVSQVHVVAAEGECKELLLVLKKGWTEGYGLTVYESGAVAVLSGGAESGAGVEYAREEYLTGWLFEPGKALLKAGAFDWPGQTFGLRKMGRHTHIYVSENPIPEELAPFGKSFRIKSIEPLNKSGIKAMGKAFPQAEVSARNVPLTSDELRRRLGVRSGGRVHLFGVHLDTAGNWLIATEF